MCHDVMAINARNRGHFHFAVAVTRDLCQSKLAVVHGFCRCQLIAERHHQMVSDGKNSAKNRIEARRVEILRERSIGSWESDDANRMCELRREKSGAG